MKKILLLVLTALTTLAVFTPTSTALESKEVYFSLNQQGTFNNYKLVLSNEPEWSARAKVFDETPYFSICSVSTGCDFDAFDTHLSIPEDLKFVASDDTVLGDEACVGDSFHLEKGVEKGEFWQDGGTLDSPPIHWVSDVRELTYNLVKYKSDFYDPNSAENYNRMYPQAPLKKLFTMQAFKDFLLLPPDTQTIETSGEQQEAFRQYLKQMGYTKISEDLIGAQYTTQEDRYIDSYGVTFNKIVIQKANQEIGSIVIYVPSDTDWENNSPADLYSVLISGNSSIRAVADVDGTEVGTWPYLFTTDAPEGEGAYIDIPTHKDGDIDPLSGIPTFRYYNWPEAYYVDVGVACSLRDGNLSKSGMSGGGQYVFKEKGKISFNASYDVECTYYFYGAALMGCINYSSGNVFTPCYISIQMPSINDIHTFLDGQISEIGQLFTVGSIGIDKSVNVVELANAKVEAIVASGDAIKFGESNALRVLVKNTGDVNVSIKGVYSDPSSKLISCDSDVISPGQQAECLLSVTPVHGEGLSVEVSYDYKSCGRSQVGLVTKTLMDSKTVRPILKEQAYLMGVHGACDNSYYSCHSASEGSLIAGYKCYKTSNGFFAPATERFNLRFDVSEVPKSAEILGAKLYLKASEVGGKQTVNVYSVDKIPEVVKCLPGGDICTKPYCGECKPLYDIDGTITSSGEISSAGQYSFDVTNSVKDRLGGGIVSLQIRGAEGLWESQGQSSCSIENDWDKRDISFDAGGRDGPYLEIVYR